MPAIMKNSNYGPLIILLAIFIVLATIFSLTVPLDATPDEREHFDLVRYIAEQKSPPLTLQQREIVGYKGDASPIYHGLVALLSQYVDVTPLPRPHSLGIPELFIPFDTILNNRNFHTENETFPFRGIVLAWHLARLVSVLMAAVTMVAIYLTALTIYPQRRYFALAVAGFAAFLPRFVINSAAVNDDNLVIPLTAFSIYYLVRILHGDEKRRTLIISGVLIGLASITKYHALVLLPEMTLAFIVLAWRGQRDWLTWLRRWGWVILAFTAAAGGWFFFLFSRFNRIAELGLIRGLMEPLGDPVVADSSGLSFISHPLAWDWIGPLFRSFWLALEGTRVFGPELIYQIFALFSLIAVFGLLKWISARFAAAPQRQVWPPGVALLGLHFLIYLGIVFVRYQTRAAMGLGYTAAPHNIQGRHLYPALISIAFFFALGLSEAIGLWPWLSTRLRQVQFNLDKALALSISGTLIALGSIAFFFFIRPTYLPYLPILTLKPEEIPIAHRIKANFNRGLKFVGYDLETPLSNSGVLPLTLYWQARADQERDYLIQVCLHGAEDQPVACHQGHPAGGLFPTRSWTAGHLIRDAVTLPLPACLAGGDYELKLALSPLRSDLASTVIDESVEIREPVSLGQIHLPGDRSNLAGNFSICTQAGCQDRGDISLQQIRQPLTVIYYTSDSRAAANANGPVRFVAKRQGSTANTEWLPLAGTVEYACPNGGQVSMHAFIVDRSVAYGHYQLELDGQLQPEPQIKVETRQRNFEPPANLQADLGISFADKLELLGYQVDLSPRWPGDTIEAILYWRAQQTTDRNYVATLHLLDDTMTMWAQTDHQVGGLYPNILWAPGEVVQDVHLLQSGQMTLPPGLYTIELGLYDSSRGFNYLPMVSTATGRRIERNPLLGQVRIMDPDRTNPPANAMLVNLNGEIRLLGYDAANTAPAGGEPLSLVLHWQAIKPPSAAYTVFTQLIGPDGLVWAQQDNQPQGGRYPTTAWAVNDTVVDRYELTLKENAPPGEYRLLVGMYNWVTGERLAATSPDGRRWPDDAIVVTTLAIDGVAGRLP